MGSSASVTIIDATRAYEAWLHSRLDVVEADLERKHQQMQGSLFAFFRATFYRFAALWPELCAELADAPKVLAVGDLHVENFGTWRDAEGRLIWGVNDFDEVARMPYPLDLTRLAASAIAARHESGLGLEPKAAAEAVLDGYLGALASGGSPFVLEESHSALREMALGAEREPEKFWAKLSGAAKRLPPKKMQKLLRQSLPAKAENIVMSHRAAGVGSLGRPRYVATAECNGGMVAREAKAWLPSAWGWTRGKPKDRALARRLLERAVRQPDPYYRIEAGCVLRRLGPHCSRIELADFPKRRDEHVILKAMGHETANLHLATADQRKAILRDLERRRPGWLLDAAQAIFEATRRDWEVFRSEFPRLAQH